MQAALAILFCLSLPLAAADKRTLIAEPVIERGHRANVLGGIPFRLINSHSRQSLGLYREI